MCSVGRHFRAAAGPKPGGRLESLTPRNIFIRAGEVHLMAGYPQSLGIVKTVDAAR